MENNTVNLQKRVKVKNLCPWALGIGQGGLDIYLKGTATISISGEVIDLLIANNNVFFCGTGNGDHAKIEILDEELKKYFGFDKQVILNEAMIDKLFEYKTDEAFEKNVKQNAVMTHEKELLYDYVLKHQDKINLTVKRMKFLENYLGKTF